MTQQFTANEVRELAKHMESVGWRPDSNGDPDCYDEGAARSAEMLFAFAAAIKQREQGANSPLKGWIFDKVNMGRGDERYICTPDGANATTVRNESTSDHRERLLWLIADAMVKESGNG